MKTKKDWNLPSWEMPAWVWLLLFAAIVLVGIFLFGCASEQKIDETTLSEDKQERIVMWRDRIEKIYETNWLATMFIVGIAASVFMIFQGVKTGWALGAGCGAGFFFLRADQALAEQGWIYAVVGAMIVVGAGWAVWNRYIKDRAFKEIVADPDTSTPYPHKITTKLIKRIKEKTK